MSEPKRDCACHNKQCARNGDCQACRAYHHSRGSLTRCEQISRKAKPKPAS